MNKNKQKSKQRFLYLFEKYYDEYQDWFKKKYNMYPFDTYGCVECIYELLSIKYEPILKDKKTIKKLKYLTFEEWLFKNNKRLIEEKTDLNPLNNTNDE